MLLAARCQLRVLAGCVKARRHSIAVEKVIRLRHRHRQVPTHEPGRWLLIGHDGNFAWPRIRGRFPVDIFHYRLQFRLRRPRLS
jgi:hypothetical protein